MEMSMDEMMSTVDTSSLRELSSEYSKLDTAPRRERAATEGDVTHAYSGKRSLNPSIKSCVDIMMSTCGELKRMTRQAQLGKSRTSAQYIVEYLKSRRPSPPNCNTSAQVPASIETSSSPKRISRSRPLGRNISAKTLSRLETTQIYICPIGMGSQTSRKRPSSLESPHRSPHRLAVLGRGTSTKTLPSIEIVQRSNRLGALSRNVSTKTFPSVEVTHKSHRLSALRRTLSTKTFAGLDTSRKSHRHGLFGNKVSSKTVASVDRSSRHGSSVSPRLLSGNELPGKYVCQYSCRPHYPGTSLTLSSNRCQCSRCRADLAASLLSSEKWSRTARNLQRKPTTLPLAASSRVLARSKGRRLAALHH